MAELLAAIDRRASQVYAAPLALLGTMAGGSTVTLDGGQAVSVVIPPGVSLAAGTRVLLVPIQGGYDFVVIGKEME